MRVPDGFSGIIETDPNDVSGLKVNFYHEPRLNIRRTEEEGRQIWDNVEMVEILVPDQELGGYDRNSAVVHKVDKTHRARFPREYAEFKARETGWEGEGMPLAMWPPMTAAKVKEMAFLGIHTVEQLAEASLPETEGVWGDKARDWLSGDVARLKARIAELEAEIEQLTAPAPKGQKKVA